MYVICIYIYTVIVIHIYIYVLFTYIAVSCTTLDYDHASETLSISMVIPLSFVLCSLTGKSGGNLLVLSWKYGGLLCFPLFSCIYSNVSHHFWDLPLHMIAN